MEHRIVASAALVAILVTGWVRHGHAPASVGSGRCEHPVGVVRDGALIVRCLARCGGRLRSLLEGVDLTRCAGGVIGADRWVGAGASVAIGQDCRVRVGRLPAHSRLVLGLALDLNAASSQDLERLPRIGPRLAGRIVADRRAHGPYETIEQLQRVSGIGVATTDRLRPLLQVAIRDTCP